jgi:4-hydroxy-tetrahydrodipicolinate reductase
MRTEPYKVIVWGPGVLGRLLIREIQKKPEFELVGVYAYTEEKDGQDAGEHAGAGHAGVAMTKDREAIFGLDADAVFMCPQTTAPVDIDSDVTAVVCRFLETGINVVSAPAYHWPLLHGQQLVDKLEGSCQKGGATIHSTGINPGLLNERWLPALTAAVARIKHITVQEINNNSHIDSQDMMLAIGYSRPPTHETTPVVMLLGRRYYYETLHHACHILGHEVEGIEDSYDWIVADKDYDHVAVHVPKGTINGIVHRYTAVVGGQPFMTLEEVFYGDRSQCPVNVNYDDAWTITIEGEPTSVRVEIAMMASIEANKQFAEGDNTLPAYYATGIPMLQAVPLVVTAPPGILYPSTFTSYKPDLRMLEPSRESGVAIWE